MNQPLLILFLLIPTLLHAAEEMQLQHEAKKRMRSSENIQTLIMTRSLGDDQLKRRSDISNALKRKRETIESDGKSCYEDSSIGLMDGDVDTVAHVTEGTGENKSALRLSFSSGSVTRECKRRNPHAPLSGHMKNVNCMGGLLDVQIFSRCDLISLLPNPSGIDNPYVASRQVYKHELSTSDYQILGESVDEIDLRNTSISRLEKQEILTNYPNVQTIYLSGKISEADRQFNANQFQEEYGSDYDSDFDGEVNLVYTDRQIPNNRDDRFYDDKALEIMRHFPRAILRRRDVQ